MLKKANCRWYTAETEQTELCPERLLDALMFFCIKKKLVFDAVVGKCFRTEFRTDAPVDAMLVFCIKKKKIVDAMRVSKNVRRQLRNIKKAAYLRGIVTFFCAKLEMIFEGFSKTKLCGIRLIAVYPRGLSKNDVKKNNSAITLGSLPKTIYQSRFAPKNKEKNNVFLMQNFMTFTKVSAPGTFLGAAQKVQNGDPK